MRGPFVRRKTHDKLISEWQRYYDRQVGELKDAIEHEYLRAIKDGKSKVRAWAVDVVSELHSSSDSTLRSKVNASLVRAMAEFRPDRRN